MPPLRHGATPTRRIGGFSVCPSVQPAGLLRWHGGEDTASSQAYVPELPRRLDPPRNQVDHITIRARRGTDFVDGSSAFFQAYSNYDVCKFADIFFV